MEAILIKNDFWDYVNGAKVRPEIVKGDAASVAAGAWDIEDRKARSDIILAIKPSELKQIKGCGTSRDVWQKLKSIYQSTGPARKATLLKMLTLLKMADDGDVHDHLQKFFDIIDKLSEMDIDVNKDLLTVMLLYSLPVSFENFRCAIESRDELPTPEILRVKIVEEYEARKNENQYNLSDAMFSKKKFFKSRNTNRKEDNKKCDSGQKSEPFKFRCHRCRKLGHKAIDCNEPRETKNNANTVYDECLLSNTENTNPSEAYGTGDWRNSELWCLDSGCSTHMGNSNAKFITDPNLVPEM